MDRSTRIDALQTRSRNTRPAIDPERAKLMTEFYREIDTHSLSAPMLRAKAFSYLLENKTISIEKDELIVGEKGCRAKAAPTYPELCCHSIDDLQILDQREKIPFQVDQKVRQIYKEEIIPYWEGRSIRVRIFSRMTEAWKEAY